MAATFTQAQIDQLTAAIASGVLTVRYSGPPSREITYQSLSQMLSLLAQMQQSVAAAEGKPSFKLAGTRKGLE